MVICHEYEKIYNKKNSFSHVTLYKYAYLRNLNLKKENLCFHDKKFKIKKRKENRWQLTNFRTIEKAEHDKGILGWFQMDCIVGKDHQPACLVLTEEKNLRTICYKLNQHNSKEVNKAIKNIFNNKIYKKNIKRIITDQGKEFSNWKEYWKN